ncbi:hypothetical protein KCA24_31110, partial [Escherichia coli]|nr:hypothetical protein [Escherichia coli]
AEGGGGRGGGQRTLSPLGEGGPGQKPGVVAARIPGVWDNPGAAKMGGVGPRPDFAQVAWLQAWHIRDETYSGSVPAEGEMTP